MLDKVCKFSLHFYNSTKNFPELLPSLLKFPPSSPHAPSCFTYRLTCVDCKRCFAADAAVGDVGDLAARRAKTLPPTTTPTEPLSCGCRVDVDVGVTESGLSVLRCCLSGAVAEGERRMGGEIRGLPLLEDGLLL